MHKSFTKSLFHASMFRAYMLIIRRSKLHYTASGIITPIGGRVKQFWPPDYRHMCSKHVEAWNKLIVKQKFCASSWLITEINILRCTVSKTYKSQTVCNIKKNLRSIFKCGTFIKNNTWSRKFKALSTVHSTYSKISLKTALQLGRNT